MKSANSIGERMVDHLERIGIERLDDLADLDAADLRLRINVALGEPRINAQGERALANLIAVARAARDR